MRGREGEEGQTKIKERGRKDDNKILPLLPPAAIRDPSGLMTSEFRRPLGSMNMRYKRQPQERDNTRERRE